MNFENLFNVRNILIAASALAFVGFLMIHNPGPDIVFNAQVGEIALTDACMDNSNDDWTCGFVLPYRWLLAGIVALTAVCLIVAPRKSA